MDPIEILGSLLGQKSRGSGTGADILKDILMGGLRGQTPSRPAQRESTPRQAPSRPSHEPATDEAAPAATEPAFPGFPKPGKNPQ